MKKEIRQQVYNKYNGKCAYCGCDVEYKNMQVDHINAKYLGGKDNIENLQPACRNCNFYKATFDIETFKKRIADIPTQLEKLFIFRVALKYGLIEIKHKKIKFEFEKENKNDRLQKTKNRTL